MGRRDEFEESVGKKKKCSPEICMEIQHMVLTAAIKSQEQKSRTGAQ